MVRQDAVESSGPEEVLRSILRSQYHASLAMMRDAIERCPDQLWSSREYTNPFWRIAYHTLYFTHLYIQPNLHAFRPWERHQTGLQYLDDVPAPDELEDLVELPDKPPQTGEPLTSADVLDYWLLCDQMIDNAVAAFDVLDPESGFFWYKVSKLEHQMISLRHIQHHTAQLMDRLRNEADIGIEWVGARHR